MKNLIDRLGALFMVVGLALTALYVPSLREAIDRAAKTDIAQKGDELLGAAVMVMVVGLIIFIIGRICGSFTPEKKTITKVVYRDTPNADDDKWNIR